MTLTMKRKKPGRLFFLGYAQGINREILDLDFDNDNEKPITAEQLSRLVRPK